ncbi:MAG: ExbD/TolR family protein [Alphaproteobacteria bacterium]|jgi:biopolymer transport protein TolR|uniref:Biopolymer transporter ExbD n=1 Tax=PS1 clade bacterium TaxID=2175152 RepID=A0A368DRT4_9PROT|nr:protein TolR [Rhodobiaceae bacterium]MBH21012.1 protein TolR [Rhodobiaceae bacterium]OUT75400.1 MAG: protein TolR [Rhizobiales bacterium TMED25]RCL73935.1 MAG: biopolymer transporter ExbD [PS1 clade bacterium]|tara:strand:- start:11 stop:445 length:435 start_codon:yes stop_codon:yes gene_type:complete
MATNINSLPNNRRRTRKNRPISDINVTPFVDVMLVLLVIFMVTAPLLTVGVPIELPKTSAKQMTDDVEPLTITIDNKNNIYIQELKVDFEELAVKLTAIGKDKFDKKIYINGDKNINYEILMRVMAKINSAGYTSIGLVTDIET